MSDLQPRPSERSRPLIAVVCAVPLLGEAMESVLEFAEVRSFSGRGGDVAGLLRWLRPEAIIVDNAENAAGAVAHADERVIPIVHISVRERAVRLFHRGDWHEVAHGEGPTPEVIRNVLIGALFAREGVL